MYVEECMVTRMEVAVVGVYCQGDVLLLGDGKRKLKTVFRKVRAEIRKQLLKQRKMMKKKQRFSSFQYDPYSYALNFDNGNFGFLC